MWIDVIFFAILIIFATTGVIKGLFDSLLGLISTGLSFAIAILCAKPATSFLGKIFPIPEMFKKMLKEDSYSLFGKVFTEDQVATFLTIVLVILIVFILIRVGIWLLARLFASAVEKSTIGSGLNKVLGGLFGLAKGFIIVIVLLVFCSFLTRVSIFDGLEEKLQSSTCTRFVYNYVSDTTEKIMEKADMQDFIVNTATKVIDQSK